MASPLVLGLAALFFFGGVAFAGDTKKEREQFEQDSRAVRELRRELEADFLGIGGLTPEQSAGLRRYIDWHLRPYEMFVNERRILSDLRVQPVGGPSGVAKTKIAEIVADRMVKAGLLLEKRRFNQTGHPDIFMDLGIVDNLGLPEQTLSQLGDTKSYDGLRNRFVKTNASIFFDEATHYSLPLPDLDAAYAAELTALEAERAAGHAVTQARAQLPKPETGEHDYEKRLIAWHAAQALRPQENVSIEEAIAAVREKYLVLKRKREALVSTMRKIWAAASGGKYYVMGEQEQVATHRESLKDIQARLGQFRLNYSHFSLFEKIDGKVEDLSAKSGALEEASTTLAKLNEEFKELEARRARSILFGPGIVEVEALREKLQLARTARDKLAAEVAHLKRQIQVFREDQANLDKAGGEQKLGELITRWKALNDEYRKKEAEIALTAAARYRINKFIQQIDSPAALKAAFPAYFERREASEYDVATLLHDLKTAADPATQYAELVKMDHRTATRIVSEAIFDEGFKSETLHFGNVSIAMAFNDPDLEKRVKARVDAIHAEGRIVTVDEYARMYQEEFKRGWDEDFFRKRFPEVFEPKYGGGASLAALRRYLGATGGIFIHPPDAHMLVNNVSSMIRSTLDHWQRTMKQQGYDVDVKFHVHENVAPIFVRDDIPGEFGPNATLEGVRGALGALLNELTHRAQSPHGLHGKIALINEKPAGSQQVLTLRRLHPDIPDTHEFFLRAGERTVFLLDSSGPRGTMAEYGHSFTPSAAFARDPATVPGEPEKPRLALEPVKLAQAVPEPPRPSIFQGNSKWCRALRWLGGG